MAVQIDEQYEQLVDADALHRLAVRVLQAEAVRGPLELGVVVTTDDRVHDLNRQYLGHDYKTDVISFGMDADQSSPHAPLFVTPDERPRYLGDVVISYDRAAEQAPEYGHGPDAEVALLMIHGILHLLGYDDTTDDARPLMHARQQQLLQFWSPRGHPDFGF